MELPVVLGEFTCVVRSEMTLVEHGERVMLNAGIDYNVVNDWN